MISVKYNNCLVECVPNFSEGRDPEIIRAILGSVIRDGMCEVWDHSSDADHNRSVFTLAGPPNAVEEAVLRFTRTAAELIDMETHEGVHPCIGATDVIPFIPLKIILETFLISVLVHPHFLIFSHNSSLSNPLCGIT